MREHIVGQVMPIFQTVFDSTLKVRAGSLFDVDVDVDLTVPARFVAACLRNTRRVTVCLIPAGLGPAQKCVPLAVFLVPRPCQPCPMQLSVMPHAAKPPVCTLAGCLSYLCVIINPCFCHTPPSGLSLSLNSSSFTPTAMLHQVRNLPVR